MPKMPSGPGRLVARIRIRKFGPSSAVFARIDRLEAAGVIRGYPTDLDEAELGFPLLAFVFIHENKPVTGEATLERLARLELAEELHRITGEDCYLLKIRARSTDDLRDRLDAPVVQDHTRRAQSGRRWSS